MSFAIITLCAASQQVFIFVVHFVIDLVWKLFDTPSYIYILNGTCNIFNFLNCWLYCTTI